MSIVDICSSVILIAVTLLIVVFVIVLILGIIEGIKRWKR